MLTLMLFELPSGLLYLFVFFVPEIVINFYGKVNMFHLVSSFVLTYHLVGLSVFACMFTL